MENSEASYNNDSGFYIGQTPQADEADALDRPQRQVVRQRARLLGHEHALRDDHEVAVVQQRHRHRPQRAGHREVRAAGGQRHHRQRHLLEQLQLLRGRAVQAARSRRRARRTRSASASCSSAAAAPRSRTTGSTATTSSGSARSSRSCSSRPTPPTSIGNQVHDNQFGLGGADLNGRELFYDGSGTGQLLRAQRRRRRPRRRPTARRSPRARSPAPTRSTRPPRPRRSAGASAIPPTRRSGSSHPHAPKRGLTPLEHYKK